MHSDDSSSEEPLTEDDYEELFQSFSAAVEAHNELLCMSIMSKHSEMIQETYGFYFESFLHPVGKFGSPKLALYLIQLDANVNEQDLQGRTPLYNAIRNKNTETYKVLVNNGADISICNVNHINSLQEALYFGSGERIEALLKMPHPENYVTFTSIEKARKIIEYILDHKIDLKLSTTDFSVLVFYAARLRDDEIFKLVLHECRRFLIDKETDIKKEKQEGKLPLILDTKEVNVRGPLGRTALHYAVRQQLPEVVRYLIEHGVDINSTTKESYTPLHYATCLENKEIIELLLNAGANVNARSSLSTNEVTPLRLVCGNSNLKQLLRPGFGLNYDEDTTRENMQFTMGEDVFNSELISLLINSGANIEAQGKNGMNALLESCKAGHLDIVQLLVKFGADIHFKDGFGANALHHAASGCHFDIVDWLLRRGLDINSATHRGNTPLHLLVIDQRNKNIEMIELLASYGANINAQNKELDTPLHNAACDKQYALECLLKLKADITIRNQQNYSPLFYNLVVIIRNLDKPPSRSLFIPYAAISLDNISDHIVEFERPDEWKEAISYFHECKSELSRMKETRICKDIPFSFYNFLSLNIYNVARFSRIEKVKNILQSRDYRKQFPAYEYFLERQIWRIESLGNSVERTMEFLNGYGNVKLPSFIIEIILSYMQVADFRNFGRALSVRRR